MKKNILMLMILGCGISGSSQTRSDYDSAVSRFQKFYNNLQTDSIYNMMSDRSKGIMPHDQTVKAFQQLRPKLGDMKSYVFTKQKDDTWFYKTVFENATLSLVMSLDKDNKLESFRFVPYLPDSAGANKSNLVLKTATGNIYGTLSMPGGGKKVPVVLIIAGSGPTDRDGNNPLGVNANTYKMISDSLAKAGIACARYDKRGTGESADAAKDMASARFEDKVKDAEGFVTMLELNPRISKVIVLGHSEGSLVGMLLAGREKVAGFISVSGAGERIDKIIEKQYGAQSKELAEKATIILDSLVKGYTVKEIDPSLDMLFSTSKQPYVRSWLKYEPQAEMKKVKEPVLIIQGTTDIQVGVEEAKNLKKACPHATLKLVKGMNHVLKQAPADREQNIATYTNPNLPLCEGFMPEIVKFVNELK